MNVGLVATPMMKGKRHHERTKHSGTNECELENRVHSLWNLYEFSKQVPMLGISYKATLQNK